MPHLQFLLSRLAALCSHAINAPLCASLRVSARPCAQQIDARTHAKPHRAAPNKMDPAKWTPSLNQRDELDRAMKTAGVLREWAALKRQGIIDDAEFQAMKARL